MKQHCDISIIGAGINGLAIASALGEQGFEVVLIDKGDVDPALRKVPDGRGIAISKRSKNILKKWTKAKFLTSCGKNMQYVNGN